MSKTRHEMLEQMERDRKQTQTTSAKCSLCWSWQLGWGFRHDPRCMACEGTGYIKDVQ